jgi:hypothetical protein
VHSSFFSIGWGFRIPDELENMMGVEELELLPLLLFERPAEGVEGIEFVLCCLIAPVLLLPSRLMLLKGEEDRVGVLLLLVPHLERGEAIEGKQLSTL